MSDSRTKKRVVGGREAGQSSEFLDAFDDGWDELGSRFPTHTMPTAQIARQLDLTSPCWCAIQPEPPWTTSSIHMFVVSAVPAAAQVVDLQMPLGLPNPGRPEEDDGGGSHRGHCKISRRLGTDAC